MAATALYLGALLLTLDDVKKLLPAQEPRADLMIRRVQVRIGVSRNARKSGRGS
jgi:hypothetical protein